MHRCARVGGTHDSLDGGPSGLARQGQGVIDHGVGLAGALVLGVDDLVHAVGCVRDEQRERARPALRPLSHGVEQGLRGGGLVCHHKHSDGDLGGLHGRKLPSGWLALTIALARSQRQASSIRKRAERGPRGWYISPRPEPRRRTTIRCADTTSR